MRKKLLILSLSLALLFFLSIFVSSVNAGDKWNKRRVNWRIAGTIVQFIDISKPIQDPPYLELVGPHSLINLTAYGPPGPAKITLLSSSTGAGSSCNCYEGYFPIAYFDKNDMVAMFPDQSLLFASIDKVEGGILCIAADEKTTYFEVKMNVTGGTGRFKRASGGVLTGKGNGFFIDPGNSDNTLVGENGRITGWIEFSDE